MTKPKFIQIQTTSRCSGRCYICPHRLSPFATEPVDMTDEIYYTVLDRLSEYKDSIKKISLYLANEPLMDKKFIERLILLYKVLPDVRVDISTNASLLTETISLELSGVLNKNSKVIISHHGTSKEQIEYMMGIPYDKTINNIIYFLQHKPRGLKVRIVGLGFSIDGKMHYFDEDEYIKYWHNIAKKNGFNLRNVSIKYSRFHSRAGTVELEGWDYDKKFKHKKVPRELTSCQICDRLMNWVHILATGDYVLCCKDYYYKTVMGNVKDMSIEELKISPIYNDYEEMMSGRIPTDDTFICKNCMIPWG